ncbi:MAG: hypothetical protein NDJ24_08680 [Alphaproteobacteria bacterium]|nr:hypothetical protein [Alphaproteobacteria bacterium]
MSRLLFLSLLSGVLLGLPGCVQADTPSEDWVKCTAVEECVIVGMGCAVVAVNKTYQAEADVYYRHQNSMMDCEPQIDPATAGVQCGHQKTACKDKWGQIDHASTCVTAHTICQIVPQPRPVSPAP